MFKQGENIKVDELCLLIYDLYSRSGVDYAIDDCREFMEPYQVQLLDEALEHGQDMER